MGRPKKIPGVTEKGMADVAKKPRTLSSKEMVAVLTTDKNGRPGTSFIPVAVIPDLKAVIFATPKNTPLKNITDTKDGILLIDSRSNKSKVFFETEAITVLENSRLLRHSQTITKMDRDT